MRRHAIALLTLLTLLTPAVAAQASGRDVIVDCTEDEVMSKTYTQKEYRDALAKLPADADQYGNCRDIIARAQDRAVRRGGSKQGDASNGAAGSAGTPGGGGTGAGGASDSTQPTAEQLAAASVADRAAAQEAARDASTPVLGSAGAPSADAVGRAPDTSGSADLPAPVLALLALLLAGVIAFGAVRIRSLVHTRSA